MSTRKISRKDAKALVAQWALLLMEGADKEDLLRSSGYELYTEEGQVPNPEIQGALDRLLRFLERDIERAQTRRR